jgi:hypothetical protein
MSSNSKKTLIYIIFGVQNSKKAFSKSVSDFSLLNCNLKKPTSLINKISQISGIESKDIIINDNNLLHTISGTSTFISSYVYNEKLSSESFYLQNQKIIDEHLKIIKEKSKIYDKILIFGFSYGAGIANSIAEKLYVQFKNKKNNNEINEIIKKIFIATFGSIYIPDCIINNEINIQIRNYLAIGDIAQKTTKINKNFNFLQTEPTENFEYIYDHQTVNIKYKRENNIIYFCYTDINGECSTSKNTIKEWKIHTSYDGLFYCLLKSNTFNIDDIIHKSMIANNSYCSPKKILNAEKLIHKIISDEDFTFERNGTELYNIIKSFCNNDENLICNSMLLLIIEKIFIFHKDKFATFHEFINTITENRNIKINNSIRAINNFQKRISVH